MFFPTNKTNHVRTCKTFTILALLASFIVESYTTTSIPTFSKRSSTSLTKSPTTSSSTTQLFGIRKRIKSIYDTITNQDYNNDELKVGIAGFYDRSSLLWENVWGEHMHHGYYIPENRTDHIQAQIDLIDQVLLWSKMKSTPKNVIDVGCGIGGSSRHIARKYPGSKVTGITLSPYQANRATELAVIQNVSDVCQFQIADALNMPFINESYDLIWSLESGEHMPNKTQFINELFRVCKPDGTIIIVTWCHRNLEQDEISLNKKELKLLKAINRAYYLPKWCSVNDYIDLLKSNNAMNIQYDDWSYIIAPFWIAVIKSSLNYKSIIGLLKSGFTTQRGAYAMFLMLRGFNKGLIKFGLISCTKPSNVNVKEIEEEEKNILSNSNNNVLSSTTTMIASSLNDMDLIDPLK